MVNNKSFPVSVGKHQNIHIMYMCTWCLFLRSSWPSLLFISSWTVWISDFSSSLVASSWFSSLLISGSHLQPFRGACRPVHKQEVAFYIINNTMLLHQILLLMNCPPKNSSHLTWLYVSGKRTDVFKALTLEILSSSLQKTSLFLY